MPFVPLAALMLLLGNTSTVIGNRTIRRQSPFLRHMPEAVLALRRCGLYTGSQRSTGHARRFGDERSGS